MLVTRENFIKMNIESENAITQLELVDKCKKIGVILTKTEVSLLQNKTYKDDHSYIQNIRTIYKNKQYTYKNKEKLKNESFKFETFESFYNCYIKLGKSKKDQETKCCYCGVKEKDLILYFDKDKNLQYKDARKRGTKLELERVVTSPKKDNLYSNTNTELACYICNNAKSDFISPSDFKDIAKGISDFWKNIVKINIEFPDKSSIWKR